MPKKALIVVRPTGGLCNRLRTIDSAVLLARRLNKPLEIVWTLGPELNCSLHALLEPSDDYRVSETRSVAPPQSWFLQKTGFLRQYLGCRREFQCVIFQSKMDRLVKQNFDFTRLAKCESVYITCCNRFYRPVRRFVPFVPVASIRNTVASYTNQYGDSAVGVHIRRTDHHVVTAFSPEQGFIDAMNHELGQNPETRFFLATDSPDILSRFSTLFGDRVLWHPKDYDRNSPKGIQDAMVDLLCLSKTKKIIGSRLSSFSETAAQLNDIALILVTDH